MLKETTARILGFRVIATFIVTVVFLLGWGAWVSADSDATKLAGVKEMGEFLFPYLGTALGFVLGYYFSGRSFDQQ